MSVHVGPTDLERPARRPVRTTRLSSAVAIGVVAVLVAAALGAGAGYLLTRPEQNELAQLRTDLAATEAKLTANAAETDALTKENSALEAQAAELQSLGTALQSQLNDVTSTVERLQAENVTLRNQLDAYTNPPPPVWPAVEYGSALQYAADWFTPAGPYLLVVDVVVTNPNDATTYFSPSDFRVKGPDNTVYSLLQESSVAAQPRFAMGAETLPAGRTELRGEEVAPGEELHGSVIFYVTSTSVTNFTITYHGEGATALTATAA